MSQFNLYLERVQDNRIYYTKEIEYYDESLKGLYYKIKKKYKRFSEASGIFLSALIFTVGALTNFAYDDFKNEELMKELNNKQLLHYSVKRNIDASIRDNIFGINYFLIKNPKVSMALLSKIDEIYEKHDVEFNTSIPYVSKDRKSAEEKLKEYNIEEILEGLKINSKISVEYIKDIISGKKFNKEEDLGSDFLSNLKKLEKINQELIKIEGQRGYESSGTVKKTQGRYMNLNPNNDDEF
jgi:phage terminase small subunit